MDSTPTAPPCYADVVAAAERLEGQAHRTPVVRSAAADALLGAEVFFKCENLQRTGSFKFRGAYNAVSRLSPQQARRGVVAYSSGNHGQALALAARLHGVAATVVIPDDAPLAKIEATRRHGAEVILFDRYTEDRDALVQRLVDERGLTLLPPFDHADMIAGQGTVALELLSVVGPLDALFLCLGGGGLLSGSALVLAERAPRCQLFGVEPEAGNDGQQSLRLGHRVRIPTPRTLADGAQSVQLGVLTFPIIQRGVTDILTVSDAELVQAMRFMAQELKLVVEPTGCLAWAGAAQAAASLRGKRVGVLLTGGNVDLARYCALLAGEAELPGAASTANRPSAPNSAARETTHSPP
jgi:threo-3-hydroxy-L-aspartate ammonia-lyase